MKRTDADWGGRRQLSLRWISWFSWRWWWGRWKYRTNCFGDTLESWWEWEEAYTRNRTNG